MALSIWYVIIFQDLWQHVESMHMELEEKLKSCAFCLWTFFLQLLSNNTMLFMFVELEMWAIRLCLSPTKLRRKKEKKKKLWFSTATDIYSYQSALSHFLGDREIVSCTKSHSLEIDNRLSNGKISLHGPWQIKELCRDEFEDLVHVYVVGCTREK